MLPEHVQPNGRDLQILTVCPLCQAAYNPLKTQVVAERDDAHLLFLECRRCGSAVMAVVTTGVAGLSSVGAVTDLTSQEIADGRHQRAVSDDDVLDVFRWLNADPPHSSLPLPGPDSA